MEFMQIAEIGSGAQQGMVRLKSNYNEETGAFYRYPAGISPTSGDKLLVATVGTEKVIAQVYRKEGTE